jgi:hypothetical protein
MDGSIFLFLSISHGVRLSILKNRTVPYLNGAKGFQKSSYHGNGDAYIPQMNY